MLLRDHMFYLGVYAAVIASGSAYKESRVFVDVSGNNNHPSIEDRGYNQFYTLEEDGDVPVVNFDTWWINDDATVSVKSVNFSWKPVGNVVNEGVRTTASLGQTAVLWYPIVKDIYEKSKKTLAGKKSAKSYNFRGDSHFIPFRFLGL